VGAVLVGLGADAVVLALGMWIIWMSRGVFPISIPLLGVGFLIGCPLFEWLEWRTRTYERDREEQEQRSAPVRVGWQVRRCAQHSEGDQPGNQPQQRRHDGRSDDPGPVPACRSLGGDCDGSSSRHRARRSPTASDSTRSPMSAEPNVVFVSDDGAERGIFIARTDQVSRQAPAGADQEGAELCFVMSAPGRDSAEATARDLFRFSRPMRRPSR
jgi:hypothetical protein